MTRIGRTDRPTTQTSARRLQRSRKPRAATPGRGAPPQVRQSPVQLPASVHADAELGETVASLYEALDRLDEAFRSIPREDVRAYWHDQRSHPEVALHFAERDALVEELRAHPDFANLETDLGDTLGEEIGRDVNIAGAVYGALCNVEWIHRDRARHTCTWRDAAGVVAEIRNTFRGTNENDMDWYCSGGEGTVAALISDRLATRGWTHVAWGKSEHT